jgi:mono/diheme cytochrome c family protein
MRRARLSRALTITVVVSSCAAPLGCRHRPKTSLERGQGTFIRSCAGCHGPDGRGSHPPGFTVAPRDLTDPLLQARLSDDALRETIHYGKGQMPPFGAALPAEEVSDLIGYVRAIARKGP